MTQAGSTLEPEWIGWQRNVAALALIVFTAFVGFSFVNPFLPLYIHELGVEDPSAIAIWSGIISAVTPGIAAILSPFWGTLADKFGRKAMLMRSLFFFSLVTAAMGLVTSVEQLLGLRLVMGFFAGFSPMAMALASVSCPRAKMPVAIGLVQSAQLISLAIGPAIGGYAASQFGLRSSFFVTAGLCLVSLTALIFLFQERRSLGADGTVRRPPRLPFRQIFSLPHFPLLLFLLLAAQFVDRGLALLVPLRVQGFADAGSVAAISGAIISVGAILAAVSANTLPRLARWVPVGTLLLIGFAGAAIGCALATQAEGWVPFLIIRGLIALCLGGSLTLSYSLGGMTVPHHQRGAAFGWLSMGVQVGTASSPLATGAIAAWSLAGAFFFDAGLALVAIVALIALAPGLITKLPADRTDLVERAKI